MTAGRSGRHGGLKQEVVENKKEEMKESMDRIGSLVHLSFPPTPAEFRVILNQSQTTEGEEQT